MAIKADTWTCAGIALAIAALVILRHARASVPATTPTYEDSTQSSAIPVWHPGDTIGGVQHTAGSHAWIARDVQGCVVTRHRYPQQVGSNVSTLIAFGWGPLSTRTAGDPDWFRARPSTEMW